MATTATFGQTKLPFTGYISPWIIWFVVIIIPCFRVIDLQVIWGSLLLQDIVDQMTEDVKNGKSDIDYPGKYSVYIY